jgi:hypothetical protein
VTTIGDLRAHAYALAVEHDVRFTESSGRAHAHVNARYAKRQQTYCVSCGYVLPGELAARIRPIRSTRAYIVALHELGHLLSDRQHPHGFGRLEREVDATHWAWRHSRIHNAVALSELDRQALGYLERYPSWPRPDPDSHAWQQIADLPRRPTSKDRKALT